VAVQTEVVYPSIPSFSSSSQLNLGPYFVPAPNKLLRAEVRGRVNFQTTTVGTGSVLANFALWALQWVPHGAGAADCVTTADGPNWLIRQQIGDTSVYSTWAPPTGVLGQQLGGDALHADWAGQLAIGSDIDLWLSFRAPTGVTLGNLNVFASIRFWWS
jgi:hypothetical protein